MNCGSLTRRWWPLVLVAALAAALMMTASPARAATDGTIAVCLKDSGGNDLTLDGDKASYQVNGGSINYVGPVGSTGCREQHVPAGATVAVWVKYNGTLSQHETRVLSSDETLVVTFYTTKVTLQYDHAIAFGGPLGNSAFFTKPSMELLSDGVNPVHFRLDGTGGASARTTLLWPVATGPGAQFSRAFFVARLLDHAGNPLSGGEATYYRGGWHSAGVTDANGNAAFAIDATSPSITVGMSYLGGYDQQGPSQASVVTFRTTLVNAKLVDADGNPLDTGTATYYAVGWRSIGNTSGGQASIELLPGSYSFAMTYNSSRQQLNDVAVGGPTTDVVFQTGRLTLWYSGPVSWYSLGYHAYSRPMEYLPGVQTFYLGPPTYCSVDIAIASGDHLVRSAIVATLTDSANHALAGGVASAYVHGWKPIGTTGANGKACAIFDGTLGNTAVAMTYNGTRQQIVQHQPTQSIYAFETTDVTVELENSGGSPIDTGTASYYAGGWHTIGNTSGGQTHVEMLPGKYSFAMSFEGTRQQQNGVTISGTTDTVTFQTTDVTVELVDSGGNPIDTGTASYYAGGWHTIGNTSGGQTHVEMLPGKYSFAMSFKGTHQQQNGVTIDGSTDTVTFQTGSVHSVSGAATSYYAGGWKPFTNDMQLLPGSYTFHFSDGTANARVTLDGGTTNTIY